MQHQVKQHKIYVIRKEQNCGSTSFLGSNKRVAVYDNTVSARTYISYIAEQAGCFAVIGRDGKLYFRSLYEDEAEIDFELFGEYKWGDTCNISKVSFEDGIRSFKKRKRYW